MEKIIIILVILALLYYIYTELHKTENFENAPAQSLGGVDDTNAINTLAQIAKNLMAGGVTVPGNMNIQGDLVFPNATTIKGNQRLHIGGEELLYILNKKGVIIGKEWGGTGDLQVQGNSSIGGNVSIGGNTTNNGNVFFGGAGPTGFNWGNEGGNGWSCLRANAGKTDDSFCMHNTHGGGTRLLPGGDMTVKGRNILAEIDAINNKKIIIIHAQFGPDLATAGVALNHLAHKANSNGSYAFDYKIGTQWDGNGYDPHPYHHKGFFCSFKCGLNGNVQQVGRGGPAEGHMVRIAC